MFSFEVDEVRYNTVCVLSVLNSRQCFSGCALHKLLPLYVVVRCRALGLVSKVYEVMYILSLPGKGKLDINAL